MRTFSTLVAMSVLCFGLGAMAQGDAAAPGAAPAQAEQPKAEHEAKAKKMSKKEATAACQAEGKKGKDLKNCVKEKRK